MKSKPGMLVMTFASLLVAAMACLPGQQPPRLDSWRVLGPGGAGRMFFPTISPHDNSLVLVASDMTGAYITEDAGGAWRMFNLRRTVSFFAFDPVNPNVIYEGAGGLWRSANRGKTWDLVFPDPASVTRIAMSGDSGSPTIMTAAGPAGQVSALAVDPADSKALYAAAVVGRDATLLVSTDWGRHWRRSAALPGGALKIYVDPRSPGGDRTLYVVGKNSVSVREGGRWKRLAPPAGVLAFHGKGRHDHASAGFPPAGGRPVIYALADLAARDGSVNGGVLVSRDGGATWNQANDWLLGLMDKGAALPFVQAVATCLTHPEVAYVSYAGLHSGGKGPPLHGVAKTADAGRTWTIVWKEAGAEAPNVHDSWLRERFVGGAWPVSLGVAPNRPDLCYAGGSGRVMRSTDGGLNWHAVYANRTPEGSYISRGLDVTTCYGVHFDPFDPKRVFVTYTDIGLCRSEDGGKSWVNSITGVPQEWRNTTYWITFDPDVRGRVWGVMSGTHDLPRPYMWRHDSKPSAYQGGVSMSDDGGRTWRVTNKGMPATAATHILLDPSSPASARVLYVAGFGKGVFKSTDGGKTWKVKNNGIAALEPFAWRLARDKNGVLYLVVARRSDDGGNDQGGALYRSRDGAEHWQSVSLPQGVNGPNGIAIDPDDAGRLYLAAWGRSTPNGSVDGGIFLSADGGGSWRCIHAADQHVYDVTIDPADPNVLYACGFESSAWRSRDRGQTWQRIRGYNFKWGHRIIPDPRNAGMLYITTFGGSVWYGPADGDPRALEDIATPVMAYGK